MSRAAELTAVLVLGSVAGVALGWCAVMGAWVVSHECSWCGAAIRLRRRTPAATEEPVSHGMCPECFEREMRAIEKMTEAETQGVMVDEHDVAMEGAVTR